MRSDAVLSADGVYRYALTRTWSEGPVATFVMLNPSTADATLDDPTIRRCMGFAESWGCYGIAVVNVYGLRATNPKDLWRAVDPVGPDNDKWLRRYASEACTNDWPLVAAWGANARPERVTHILTLPHMDSLKALGVTKAGQPRHPLYLRGDTPRSQWPPLLVA